MTRLIEILLDEHRNIEKLLLVLEQELSVFDHTESPDYEILQAIVEYFLEYPESYHHPKEDIIFEKLKLRDPTAVATVGNVEAEHQLETERLHRFAQAVDAILAGREYPRQNFHNVVREFIDHQRQHMHKEEEILYPATLKSLRAEDWAEIDARLTSRDDPLFGGARKKKFDALRQTVLRWEQETQANR
ncbi:MAG TPA: hemerythrin domain-containing protein [Pseudolabrys sp.]|nr:hemerythrin domain-containing protein [Pseudolabrys sp.]